MCTQNTCIKVMGNALGSESDLRHDEVLLPVSALGHLRDDHVLECGTCCRRTTRMEGELLAPARVQIEATNYFLSNYQVIRQRTTLSEHPPGRRSGLRGRRGLGGISNDRTAIQR